MLQNLDGGIKRSHGKTSIRNQIHLQLILITFFHVLIILGLMKLIKMLGTRAKIKLGPT